MRPLFLSLAILLFVIGCKNSTEKSAEEFGETDELTINETEENYGMDQEDLNDLFEGLKQLDSIGKFFGNSGMTITLEKDQLSEKELNELMDAVKNDPDGYGSSIKITENSIEIQPDLLQEVMGGAGSNSDLAKIITLLTTDTKTLAALSEDKTETRKNLRAKLNTKEVSFIEDDLLSDQVRNINARHALVEKINNASGEEVNILVAEYYKIDPNEVDILKKMPPKTFINSETSANAVLKTELPVEISNYLKNSKASNHFKNLTETSLSREKRNADRFIRKSQQARDEFYQRNPGWYGEGQSVGDTYTDSRMTYIYLPLGDLSFADRVISHQIGDPPGANADGSLGIPDMPNVSFPNGDTRICNLGIRGVLTLEFTDNAIADVNGPDLYVFEMGAIEPTNLEISKNGVDWINVGRIDGGTAKVDIAPFCKPGDTFNYIRLTDLESPSALPGADVDAVAAIGGALRLHLDSSVLFDTGKFELKESASAELKALIAAIKRIPKGTLIIEGHTDNVGSPASNLTLSENRAKEVSEYLKKHLSASYKFEIKGFGETQPIAANNSEENKQKNRRVEILVVPSN
ncbi:OmpA family protein [Constantimarinum furrinae]|uniref:OmpA family membrane protein n=1 Tax=Constantimarinum furrinae TaxID=2562285 RepID=A0A7G8PUF1_9FLAO|nr:OmpA family protein [Constantimarinum furrinae]QNJ97967.1 OmpA family membrane protein [Constantimarinum furrinae]